MLNFYFFILSIYISMISVLVFNTRKKSEAFSKYQALQRQNLLKIVLSQNLIYINVHVIFMILIQLYVSWCAIGILKILCIFEADSILGVVLISIVIFLFLIKRILTITAANKSVLYL